jgi:hypothetical protein
MPSLDFRAVAWLRWIVGHQVLFMLWRLLGESLNRALGRGGPGPDVGAADALIDVCSVLLLYCGSCTSATYLSVIRPAMARQHPAFSGEWAVDYRRIPRLVREATRSGRQARRLHAAWLLNQRVHAAVANRLVPGQRSLLRRAGRRQGIGPSEEEAELFDRFFRTRRVQLCRQGFELQLRRRLVKVISDLRCYGLYYDSSSVSVSMRGRYRDRVAWLESRAVAMLADQTAAVDDGLGGGHG